MLDELTFWYLGLEEQTRSTLRTGVLVCSGIASGFLLRSTMLLPRTPYFVYVCALVAVAAFANMVWLGYTPAVINGFGWAIVLIDLLVAVFLGVATMMIATARSRDAYGNSGWALLGFIPLLNLVLMFAPPKNKDEPTLRSHVISGPSGILLGIGILFVGAFANHWQVQASRQSAASDTAVEAQQQAVAIVSLAAHGLDDTLAKYADAQAVPVPVDEYLDLVEITAADATLRITFQFRMELDPIAPEVLAELAREPCAAASLRTLIDAGATIERVYRDQTGKALGTSRTNAAVCAA